MVRVYALIGWTCAYSTLRIRKISKVGPFTCMVMASKGETVCVLECVVRGHYIYKAMWTPNVGEILAVEISHAIGAYTNKA